MTSPQLSGVVVDTMVVSWLFDDRPIGSLSTTTR